MGVGRAKNHRTHHEQPGLKLLAVRATPVVGGLRFKRQFAHGEADGGGWRVLGTECTKPQQWVVLCQQTW